MRDVYSRRMFQAGGSVAPLGPNEYIIGGIRYQLSDDKLAELRQGIGSALAGYGAQFGGLGRERQDLGARQRAELMQLGAVPRDLVQTRLDRLFQQQLAQQGRPLGILGQIAQLLPRFEGSRTQIESTFGPPIDPRLAGLQAGVGAYRGFMGADGFGGGS